MEIELKDCKNNVVGKALVSPEDFDKVNKYSWCLQNIKKEKATYAKGTVNRKSILMHQFIMGNPPKKGLYVDHKNNNSLDNQRGNLHFVTAGANNQNRQKKANTKNKYIGVKLWKGKFAVTQGGIRLGTFESEEEAARHYDKYVTIKYEGGSPKTNFPVAPEDTEGLTLEDLIVTEPKVDRLPDNISISKKTKKYIARKMYQGKLYSSPTVDTLDEAIVELKKIDAEIEEIYNKFVKEHYMKPVIRNTNKEAIVSIKQTNNDTFLECIVDDEFWHELTLFNWWMNGDYAYSTINKKMTSMHSFLLSKKHTMIDVIDHINNNCLDNRMSNLRTATFALNAHNKKKKEGCSSQYIGVHKKGKRWQVMISNGNNRTYVGSFDTELEAAMEYNKKAKELYGDNANLNKFD